jgi:cytochrome c oxidase cbb3-type subunit 3
MSTPDRDPLRPPGGGTPPAQVPPPDEADRAPLSVPDPASPLVAPGGDPVPEPLVGADATDRAMIGHVYDGIREYDNPMPGWWVALFWATVLFAPVYVLGVHVFDFIDSYEDDFAERGAQLAAAREAYAASGAFSTEPAALTEYMNDEARVAAGAAAYATVCAACHGAAGEGLIGPNLTDDFWIHGATAEVLWTGINEGYPAAGMPPWKDALSDEDRAGLLAFIKSIQDTEPATPKAPQGDPATL